MTIIEIYTGSDFKSYFKEHPPLQLFQKNLGEYSNQIAVKHMYFRTFKMGEFFDWHNTPQPLYIIYISGIIEVTVSGGEIRQLQCGEILLANDLTGAGHQTKALSSGESIIVTVDTGI